MKIIRLKKKPSFYVDLRFSTWLAQDKILSVVLDRQNRVEQISLDSVFYPPIYKELQLGKYI